MEVILLGTASAGGSAERDNTYLLFRRDDGSTMVDVGGNPLGKLKKLNIPLDEIDEVVFTHFHIDHIYGLPSLLWGMWIVGRTKPLTLYCSTDNEAWLNRWLDVIGAAEWPVKFDIRIVSHEWTEETVLKNNEDFVLSTFPSIHVEQTVGLKIDHNGKVLIYSADTMPNERIKNERKLDILIHEATTAVEQVPKHTSLKDVIHYYQIEQMEKVVLVHLTDGEPYGEVIQGADPAVKEKIKIGFDLMRFSV